MPVYTLTVEDIPDDDPWNWGPGDEEPFDEEWVFHDDRGQPIAVTREHDGIDAEAALRAMVSDQKIYADWTDIHPDGRHRWKVTIPDH